MLGPGRGPVTPPIHVEQLERVYKTTAAKYCSFLNPKESVKLSYSCCSWSYDTVCSFLFYLLIFSGHFLLAS